MASALADYDQKARNAIKAFWGVKDAATKAQVERGAEDIGSRSAVTAGKHLDAFVPILRDVASAHGLKDLDFIAGRQLSVVPGFFRPTKEWDLIVTHRGMLVAVFELKSIGSSFGNNMNNRSEEAIGAAHDFWTAYREGAFGKDAPKPFLGWVMIMRQCKGSEKPLRTSERHFPVFPEFRGASYASRCDLLCQKLVLENLYSAAALMLTPDEAGKKDGVYTHLSETGSLKRFLSVFHGHMAAIAAELM